MTSDGLSPCEKPPSALQSVPRSATFCHVMGALFSFVVVGLVVLGQQHQVLLPAGVQRSTADVWRGTDSVRKCTQKKVCSGVRKRACRPLSLPPCRGFAPLHS